ncbi:hypothetical protein BaRGS_00017628 [Batillaria attramentaria]|uniref:Uncharacterized protein n=1 Tax=Batillaria attramentaria TaxID=370345 RepID=A0ABD0KVU4_9CAEN
MSAFPYPHSREAPPGPSSERRHETGDHFLLKGAANPLYKTTERGNKLQATLTDIGNLVSLMVRRISVQTNSRARVQRGDVQRIEPVVPPVGGVYDFLIAVIAIKLDPRFVC